MILLFLLSACGRPALNGLDPSSGAPHTLVEIEGSKTFVSVNWDAGTPTESVLGGRFFGSGPFSVPHNAGLGPHPVQLGRGNMVSNNVIDFSVTDSALAPFPSPRLNYFSLYGYQPTSGDSVQFFLFVQGANIDVGGTVVINGQEQFSEFWRGLRNDLKDVDPTTLKYPIYHYGMLLTLVEAEIGDVLNVSIINDGGATSNVRQLVVPAPDQLDSDGDGLLDGWEENGYDANGDSQIDVDLPALGADPYRFDIFVEVDTMVGKNPNAGAWAIVEEAFSAAPLINPFDSSGIHIHIDRGQETFSWQGQVFVIPPAERQGGETFPFATYIRMDGDTVPFALPGESVVNFYNVKSQYFQDTRGPIFHYGVFANRHGHGARSTGRGETWGNDFFITLNNNRLAVAQYVAGTFMHELGHNFNFRHGGGDDGDNTQREPNYMSVMSYYTSDGSVPGTYQMGGIDAGCDAASDTVYDYSRGTLADLDENNLDESAGLCDNVNIDWNKNGNPAEVGIVFDISQDTETVLDDYDNWGRMYLNFRLAPEFGD